jgi:hypothetical protein
VSGTGVVVGAGVVGSLDAGGVLAAAPPAAPPAAGAAALSLGTGVDVAGAPLDGEPDPPPPPAAFGCSLAACDGLGFLGLGFGLTGSSGNAALRRPSSACAVTHTGVCRLVAE